MNRASYSIFKPTSPKNQPSNNQILLLGWLIGFLLVFAIQNVDDSLTANILLAYYVVIVLLTLYWGFTSMWTYRELNGEFVGGIEFSDRSIIVNGIELPLQTLKQIDLSLGDYSGKFVGSTHNDFNPKLSTGVDNYVFLTEANGSMTQIYFKVSYKGQTEDLTPFIIKIMQLGHISFLRCIGLLNINDYDEIQEFKRTYLKA